MKQKLISLLEFTLEIDWLSTTEFCKKYNAPLPYWTGNEESSALMFIHVDAHKWRHVKDYAKFLNKKIDNNVLTKTLGFEIVPDTRGGYPMFKCGKYEIMNDSHGWYLCPYDSVDGARIHKLNDLVDLNLEYIK